MTGLHDRAVRETRQHDDGAGLHEGGRRRNRALAGLAALTVVALVALAGVLLLRPAPAGTTAAQTVAPRPAPPLAGETLDGSRFDLADWSGDVVVVNVWASWCAPCREEMPELVAVQRELGARGLQVVGINSGDDEDAARAFAAATGAAFPHVLDRDGRIAVDWGVPGLPATMVVDRSGRVVERTFGPVTRDWVLEAVEPWLER